MIQLGDVDIWVNNATTQSHCVKSEENEEEAGKKRNEVTLGDLMEGYSVGRILTSLCDHMTAPKYYNDVIRRDVFGLMPFTAYAKNNFTEFVVSKYLFQKWHFLAKNRKLLVFRSIWGL